MTDRTVFMFSGQGSQYYQMGRELFDRNDVFRDWILRLDGMARDLGCSSIVEAIYAGDRVKVEPFERTLLTHPAIFMVEYSLAQSLIADDIVPDLVLGASLGSFAAAAVAGCVDVEHALSAVIRQAAILEERCAPGGMLAVLSDPGLFDDPFLASRAELASINFATHFVLSARRESLFELEIELKRRRVTYQRLPVSRAFHSSWIDEAQSPYESFLRSIPTVEAALPVMCCDCADLIARLPGNYFWKVVRGAIRFREAVTFLEQRGACKYVDVGPAGTLATFLKYGLPKSSQSTIHSILTPYGQDCKNLSTLRTSLGR